MIHNILFGIIRDEMSKKDKKIVHDNKEQHIKHEGKDFFYTGKQGRRNKDGMHGREYSYTDDETDERLWIYDDGSWHFD